jgi:hypothetical protein
MRQPHPTTIESRAESTYWIEPDTGDAYPVEYPAYRHKRETQDRWPPRHRLLTPDVDHLVWQRAAAAPDVEVVITIRPGTPHRVRRLVAETLRAIRRGRSATDAIRRVARRFGLRHGRARDFISAGVSFERRPLEPVTTEMFGRRVPQLRATGLVR